MDRDSFNKSALSNTKSIVLDPTKIKFLRQGAIRENAGPQIKLNLKTLEKKVQGNKISEDVLERTMELVKKQKEKRLF
jgi:hypothetical protein